MMRLMGSFVHYSLANWQAGKCEEGSGQRAAHCGSVSHEWVQLFVLVRFYGA